MTFLRYVRVGDYTNGRGAAPLQQVSATGLIRDNVAQVTVVQTFLNPFKNEAIEAAYQFPCYEGVAVCGFEAEVDGRKIVGRVQEKVAARKEFEEAVNEGKTASLLEQERPDVFQTSIGNIPPGKEVFIRLTLISEIKNDADENQIRFVLPTVIAPRYGDHYYSDASELALTQSSTSASKLFVDLLFAMSQPVTSIQSPSHTIEVHLGTNSPETEPIVTTSFDPKCARVSLTADSFLDSDLVIVVKSPGLDKPRAVVECHPTEGTHAVALTFSPRFALNPIRSSELIFLVDRSGSMQGKQIEQAGQALHLFLKSIPSENHYINIVGFGSTHKALFPKSVEYDESSLKMATSYAKSLQADMGGTEIASAFQEVFERRRRDVPTQIFLLTDGQVWNVDILVGMIREAVEEGETLDEFVRVFSLGVGNSVSHNLIEGVARAGDGYAQVVVEGERMEKKVVQLLKAALTPPVTDMWVQWLDCDGIEDEDDVKMSQEHDFEIVEVESISQKADPSTGIAATTKPPISLFSSAPEEPTPPTRSYLLPKVVTQISQAPFRIPPLYRGARFTVSAILSPSVTIPKQLVLRGTSPDGPVELRIEVGPVKEGDKMLHTLIARALLRELEEGSSYVTALVGKPSRDSKGGQLLKRLGIRLDKADSKEENQHPISSAELTKREMINLGMKYGLSSKHTSLIAIDECSVPVGIQPNDLSRIGYLSGSISRESAPRHFQAFQRCSSPGSNQLASAPIGFGSAPSAGPRTRSQFGSGASLCRVRCLAAPQTPTNDLMMCVSRASSQQASVPINASSIFGSHISTAVQPQSLASTYRPHDAATGHFRLRMRQKKSTSSSSAIAPQKQEPPVESDQAVQEVSRGPHMRLHALVQQQSFDGSFPLTPELGALFHASVQEMQLALNELLTQTVSADHECSDEEWRLVWATCLAILYMKEQLPELQEEWEMVVEKAAKKVEVVVQSSDVVAMVKDAAMKFATSRPEGGLKEKP